MYCSFSSKDSGEPLYASAGNCDLEFYFALPKKSWNKDQVLYSESIPDAIREWYFSELKSGKRWSFRCYEDTGISEDELKVYIYPLGKVVCAIRTEDFLYEVQKLLNGENAGTAIEDRKLFICTDGPHDRCCGEFGYQVFQRAAQLARDTNIKVYECSHLGGHKYAATMKIYPSNVMYGRVTTDSIEKVMEAIKTERIFADCYRGRGLLSLEETIAEYKIYKDDLGTLLNMQVESIS